MARLLMALSGAIHRLNRWIGRGVSWLTFVLVLLVTADVVMRYLFRVSFTAQQELEWHLFAVIFLLGGGYTLSHNGHVRVDIFYQRLPRRGRALIDLLGSLVFLFPGCYLVITSSIPFVADSFRIGETSPNPGGLPARWLLKAAIPLGFALMALEGVALFIDSLLELTGTAPAGRRREGRG